MLASLKGPKYLYSRIQGFYIRNYYYDLGKYAPEQYLGPFGFRLRNVGPWALPPGFLKTQGLGFRV